MTNSDLTAAKKAKKDEFYTDLVDIQKEISNYPDKFKDKVVFCNCDDPFESNFIKYFLMNFNRLGLKELIAAGYKIGSISGDEVGATNTSYALRVTDTSKYLVGEQKDLDLAGAIHFLQTEGNRIKIPLVGNTALYENGEQIQISVKEPIIDEEGNPVLNSKGKQKTKTVKQDLYYEPGDFRSDMSLKLLDEADIICTNPPFSLFREYISVFILYNKNFLVIGNMNAITYKEIFPLIRDNKLWLGNNSIKEFKQPDGNVKKFGNILWFTNIDHAKRHQRPPLNLDYVYEGHEDMYPKYDNYDAINVDKTAKIPCDYEGVMGVPITFLDKYCPEQFEILGLAMGATWDHINDIKTKKIYKNAIQHSVESSKTSSGGKINTGPAIKVDSVAKGKYYTADDVDGVLIRTYARILIRRKNL